MVSSLFLPLLLILPSFPRRLFHDIYLSFRASNEARESFSVAARGNNNSLGDITGYSGAHIGGSASDFGISDKWSRLAPIGVNVYLSPQSHDSLGLAPCSAPARAYRHCRSSNTSNSFCCSSSLRSVTAACP